MEFKEVVKNRYSCKKYSDRQVEPEKLTAILEAGRLAPTAKNLQEQHIYVTSSRPAATVHQLCSLWHLTETMCSPILVKSAIPV